MGASSISRTVLRRRLFKLRKAFTIFRWLYCYCLNGRPIVGRAREVSIESVSADAQQCPPDVEEIAEGYCMETLERTACIAFEEHYLACPRCTSIVTSTNEYIRSMKAA